MRQRTVSSEKTEADGMDDRVSGSVMVSWFAGRPNWAVSWDESMAWPSSTS